MYKKNGVPFNSKNWTKQKELDSNLVDFEIARTLRLQFIINFLEFTQFFKLTTETLPEYKTQALKKSRFILSHYGMFKGCWDWLILVATFYVAIVVPFNAAFVKSDRQTMPSDVTVEAMFIIGRRNAPHTHCTHLFCLFR